MKCKILLFLLLIGASFAILSAQEPEEVSSCVTCHEMLGAPYDSIVTAQQSDVHGNNGIACAECHGGDPSSMDPDQAMSESAGYIGIPNHTEIPEVCADCHSDAAYMGQFDPGLPVDQMTKYLTSMHGERLQEGDSKVAECASCHGAHGIMPVDDPRAAVYPTNVPQTCNKCHGDEEYMAEYNIPTDQFQEYSQSVHGIAVLENQDLGAPACNDCHGNHGAIPPGIASISQVCGTCHPNNQQLFQGSLHEPIFDMMGLPECETCHGNHEVQTPTDQMIGVNDQSVCMNCHGEGDAGYTMAKRMAGAIDSLANTYQAAQVAIQQAEQRDMNVEDLQFNLRNVRQELIQTRTMIHSFDTTQVNEHKEAGLSAAGEIITQANSLVDEFYFRRFGFVIFTLIITVMAILLYLKIRNIEGRQQKK